MDILHIETDITSYVISGKTLKYVCRTCLQNQNNMLSIFSRNEDVHKTHAEILMAFTPINISENDGHSNYICSTCVEFIVSVYTFQQHCIQVDAILRFAAVNISQEDETSVNDTKTDHSKELNSTKMELTTPENVLKIFSVELSDKKIELKEETSEKEESIICEICGDELLDGENLNEHIKNHKNNLPCDIKNENKKTENATSYTCTFCDISFKSRPNLKTHEIKWHPEMRNIKTEYNCEICGRIFSTRSSLNQHCITHNNNSKYECDCGKKFKRYSSLILHKRSSHSAIRPYQCNECGKTFAQNVVLKNHKLTHNGDKPYKCNYCEKHFRQKPHVQSHELIHTGGKPYHCLICGKQFRHQNSLIHHNRIHTGENPFHCPVCNRGFYHSTNMKKHLLSHTKNKKARMFCNGMPKHVDE
ncbi:zinc finger protein 625-like [Chrysoperla carnea]|uniref:zinc finger protein 625-like n=1 Tax=Chrysoperla carnea TaxID=189513 RepID=UPI001D084215|nr:zinc finger protein 625-like [Chrysoperla carnea]